MVVSEMGEQWSPHTAPARQAAMEITSISDSPGNTAQTMGIRMVKVPQLVPVEKARKTETIIPEADMTAPTAGATTRKTEMRVPEADMTAPTTRMTTQPIRTTARMTTWRKMSGEQQRICRMNRKTRKNRLLFAGKNGIIHRCIGLKVCLSPSSCRTSGRAAGG